MLIDFNGQQARTIAGMNGGSGEISAKMHMSESGKIIPSSIHNGGSIGMRWS